MKIKEILHYSFQACVIGSNRALMTDYLLWW